MLGVLFPPLYHPLLKKGISSTNNGSGHDISLQDTIKGEPCQAKRRIRLQEDLVVRMQGGCIQIHRWRGVICSWNCHLINIQIFASATILCDGNKCSSGMCFPFSSYIVYLVSLHRNPQTSSVMEAKAHGPDRTHEDCSPLCMAARLDKPTELMAAHGYATSWVSKGADKEAEWWFDTVHSMGLDVGYCQFCWMLPPSSSRTQFRQNNEQ